MTGLAPFRALLFGPEAPRVPGGDRVDVGPLVTPDAPVGGGGPSTYAGAARALAAWRARGLLVPDTAERLWALEVRAAEPGAGVAAVQCGVVGALRLDDEVVPHEATDDVLVAERMARLRALPVDLSPITVYTTTRLDEVADAVDAARTGPPAVQVHDETGGRFRLWPLPSGARVTGALRTCPGVVADGHHRVEAARRVAATGGDARTLAFVVPRHPVSRPVHRVVRAAGGVSIRAVLEQALTQRATVDSPAALAALLRAHRGPAFGVVTADRAAVMVPRDPAGVRARLPAERSPLWRALDAVIWEHGILPQLSTVQTSVVDDLDAAVGALGTARDVGVVMLRTVDTDVVTRLALSGERLPAKVTWFFPKPRTGLLVRAAS